jgi:predicted Rossmann fold nucleotide-binding protein DprA/Smf involved in DNA uptake
LRDGAVLIAATDDALTLLGLSAAKDAIVAMPALPDTEQKVWDALANGFTEMDSLPAATGQTMAECLAAVTSLEILGLVECSLAGEIRRR